MKTWHAYPVERVFQELGISPEVGLTLEQVQERQRQYGVNELKEAPPRSLWIMLVEQFTDYLILILIGAALVSAFLGEIQDSVVIMIIVLINALLSVIQERKAENALAALKAMSAPQATVKRGGRIQEIPANQLVPGDIIFFEAGKYIPADARIIHSANLQVQEAALTGESVPVEKTTEPVQAEAGLGDRTNMVFMGTVVSYGRGSAVVTGTGMETEIGKIAGMLQEVETESTPLQRRLDSFGKRLGQAILGIVVFIFIVGVVRGFPAFEMFMTAVSLAVAAIPEGLPAIVTIVLALGVQRMSIRNAIIRRLPAVETLGAATVICSDKTGTLTMNDMTVRQLVAGLEKIPLDEADLTDSGHRLLLEAGMLCNDSEPEEGGRFIGDPTETALAAAGVKAGLDFRELKEKHPRLKEIPFDSERKRMTTVHRWPEEELSAVVKGAPDTVLPHCTRIYDSGEVRELTQADREKIQALNEEMAGQALRVLAVAYRPDIDPERDDLEEDLIYLGLQGMIDPPRPEALEAVKVAQRAGIRTIMITGDHRRTAMAIADELGILKGQEIVTGAQLEEMSDEELASRIDGISVFARVAPQHKVRIVKALKSRGEIVAMTGDGVNDGPALKHADIGAAMGKVGTDVAKEASDMVLADDNFATIVAAVKEGRVIFENIRKAIYFLLACNAGEVLSIFAPIMLGWRAVPLLPIQILWINLITDSFPALALGVEPAEDGLMERPPRPVSEGLFRPGTGFFLGLAGVFIGGITLVAYFSGLKDSLLAARSMAFATLSLAQLFFVFNFRSLTQPLTEVGLFGNPKLVLGVGVSILLQLIVFILPPLREIFGLTLLSPGEVWTVVFLAGATLLFGELAKRLLVMKPSEYLHKSPVK
ncbi:MAG: cation-translocating P-type ATPase [Firmicutes bacterium]|nr:cation-translocating P-type ATPase [Bacillota bacterium]